MLAREKYREKYAAAEQSAVSASNLFEMQDLKGYAFWSGTKDTQESEFSYNSSSAFLTDDSRLRGDAVHHDLRSLDPDSSRFRWNLPLRVALRAPGVSVR